MKAAQTKVEDVDIIRGPDKPLTRFILCEPNAQGELDPFEAVTGLIHASVEEAVEELEERGCVFYPSKLHVVRATYQDAGALAEHRKGAKKAARVAKLRGEPQEGPPVPQEPGEAVRRAGAVFAKLFGLADPALKEQMLGSLEIWTRASAQRQEG